MIIISLSVLGLLVGSFLNVVIDRLPVNEQVARGRSRCDHCKQQLRWKDLIPVISRMMLGGRCRYCNAPVPIRNTVVELLTAALFASSYVLAQDVVCISVSLFRCSAVLLLQWAIISSLIVIFFIDLKHKIIPDRAVIVMSCCAALLQIASPAGYGIVNAMLAALGALLFFMLLISVTRGRGMGWGDAKFSVAMGLLLGFPGIVPGLYVAFLTGAIVSVMLILLRRLSLGKTIPFGPFLVVATASIYVVERIEGGVALLNRIVPLY